MAACSHPRLLQLSAGATAVGAVAAAPAVDEVEAAVAGVGSMGSEWEERRGEGRGIRLGL